MSKVPYIRKSENVEKTKKIEVGLCIDVNKLGYNFKIISVSRWAGHLYIVANKDMDTVMIDWDRNACTVNTTFITPDKVTHINGIPSIYVHNGMKYFPADFNTTLGEIVYPGIVRKDVERPVQIGDILTTPNKKFVVEHIASDGSIVALVEGKSEAKMTKECVMFKHTDKSLSQAIRENLIWKS